MDAKLQRLLDRFRGSENTRYIHTAYQTVKKSLESKAKECSPKILLKLCAAALEAKQKPIAMSVFNYLDKIESSMDPYIVALSCLLHVEAFAQDETGELRVDESTEYILKAVTIAKELNDKELMDVACTTFYRIIRVHTRPAKLKLVIDYIREVTTVLLDSDMNIYPWKTYLTIVLFEAYLKNKKKAKAGEVVDKALSDLQTTPLTEEIVPLLVRALESGVKSSIRSISLMINACNSQTSSTTTEDTTSNWSTEPPVKGEAMPCSGENMLALERFGVGLRSRLTMLRKSSKSSEEKNKKLLDLVHHLDFFEHSTQEKCAEEAERKVVLNEEENKEGAKIPLDVQRIEPEAMFSLLLDLGHLAITLQATNVCEYCVEKCKQMLMKKEVFDRSSAEFLLDLLTLRFRLLCDSWFLTNNQNQLLDIHRQYLVHCHQLLQTGLKKGLSSSKLHTGCTILWSICLPLFQRHTRGNMQLQESLELILCVLDRDQSLDFPLRCQAHWMLAHCLTDLEQLPQAVAHLEKALRFEDSGELRDAIIHMRDRLTLRSNLYDIPKNHEDMAGQMLEHLMSISPEDLTQNKLKQLFHRISWPGRETEDQETIKEVSLEWFLKGVGETLAPGTFSRTWDICGRLSKLSSKRQETNELAKQVVKLNDSLNEIQQLATNAKVWSELSSLFELDAVNELIGQSKNSKDAQKRVLLWKDLANIARRFRMWDLAMLASRYCMLYDLDGIYSEARKKIQDSSLLSTQKDGSTHKGESTVSGPTTKTASISTFESSKKHKPNRNLPVRSLLNISLGTHNLHEINVMRALAEMNCLYAESLCVLLRNQFCQPHLGGEMDRLPTNWSKSVTQHNEAGGMTSSELTSSHTKKREMENETKREYWQTYCEWLHLVSQTALLAFQRSARISTELRDAQLFQTYAACLWNHALPAVCAGEHEQLVETFQVFLECAETLDPSALPLYLHCELASVYARGLIKPWMPTSDLSTALFPRQRASSPAVKAKIPTGKGSRNTASHRRTSSRTSLFTVSPEGRKAAHLAFDRLMAVAKLVNRVEDTSQSNQHGHILTEKVTVCETISRNSRYHLTYTWMVTRQLLSTAPTYRHSFPGDMSERNTVLLEVTEPSIEEVRVSGDHKESVAKCPTGSPITVAMLAVHAIWLTNRPNLLCNWGCMVRHVLNLQSWTSTVPDADLVPQHLPPFKDVLSINKAVELMKRAFTKKTGFQRAHLDELTDSDNHLSYVDSASEHKGITVADRVVELQLWTQLIQCALLAQDYHVAFKISELINLEQEAYQTRPSRCDYYTSIILYLRGLAIFGLFRIFKTQRFDAHYKKQSQLLVELDVFEDIKPLARNHELIRMSDKNTIETNMFAAAEEALFTATQFASRTKRHDLMVLCSEAYWKMCSNSELTMSPGTVHLFHKCTLLREHCKLILELLVNSLDTYQRAKLNELIRSAPLMLEEEGQERTNISKQDIQANDLFELIEPLPPTMAQFKRDLQLRAEMYMVLFDVHLLENDNDAGLSFLSNGLRQFPRTKHRIPLFKRLVLMKAKLGHPVHLDMQKFSNQPEPAQAEIWRAIAYDSLNKKDQFFAFRSAIEVLKSTEHDQIKAELLMEFAQWMMTNRFETRSCIAMVEQAIDLLFSTDNLSTSIDRRAQRIEQDGSAEKWNKQSSRQKSKSPGRELERTQSPVRNPANTENTTRTQIESLTDVQRLDALLRAFVLLADLMHIESGHILENNWLQYILLAVACVRQIWMVVLRSTKQAAQLLQKTPSTEREDTKTSKRSAKESAIEKTSVPLPQETLPTIVQDWAVFEASNETFHVWQKIYETWNAKNESPHRVDRSTQIEKNGELQEMKVTEEYMRQQINRTTFTSPLITVSSLTRLTDLVTEVGMTHLALPVLTLQHCLTASKVSVRKHPELVTRTASGNQLTRLKILEVCCSLNISTGVEYHKSHLGTLYPDEKEVSRLLNHEQSSGNNVFTDYVVENWLQLAYRLAKLSQGGATRSFLKAAERFARRTEHKTMLLFVKATLAFVEGQCQLARDLLAEITKLIPSDEQFVFDCSMLRIDSLSADPALTLRRLPDADVLHSKNLLEEPINTHFGQRFALEELRSIDKQLRQRAEAWHCRMGWYNGQRGMVLARQGELEARQDESTYQLAQIYSEQPQGTSRETTALLARTSGAPSKFLEVIKLLDSAGQTRSALRLGWLPLAAYWKRALEVQVANYISELPGCLQHPSSCCNHFGNALKSAQNCLKQALEVVTQAESIITPKELLGCSLPVHRDLLDAKFGLVSVYLSIMRAHAAYERAKLEQDKRKEPLARAVDVFISNTDAHDDSLEVDEHNQWKQTIGVAFDSTFTLLSEVLTDSEKLPDYRIRCRLYLGEALKLQGDLLIPDSPDSTILRDEYGSETMEVTLKKAPEECPVTLQQLHSGYRWRSRRDIILDIKGYESSLQLYAHASRILASVLVDAITENFLGIAKNAAELLYQCVGDNSDPQLTNRILHGYQSCAVACRMRTHLTLASLGIKISSSNKLANAGRNFGYVATGTASRTEVMLRQMVWLYPSAVSHSDSLAVLYGLCSGNEPNSCVETLAWITGLRANLLNSRFASKGGLSSGPNDHCFAISPWFSDLMNTLLSTSNHWSRTSVNASIIFDPMKSLSETLLAVPGMTLQMALGWDLFLMEHSSDCRFLYVSFPKQLKTNEDSRKSSNKETEYLHFEIPTSRSELLQTVWSWKHHVNGHTQKKFSQKEDLFKLLQSSNCLKQLLNYVSKLWIQESTPVEKELKGKEGKTASKLKRANSKSPSKTRDRNKTASPAPSERSASLSTLPQNGIILLADSWFLELPLETLLLHSFVEKTEVHITPHLLDPSITLGNGSELTDPVNMIPLSWITRDFSFHVLQLRVAGQQTARSPEQVPQKRETGSDKSSNRATPLGEKVNRGKGTKPSRQSASGCFGINSSSFRLLCDHRRDTQEGIGYAGEMSHVSTRATHDSLNAKVSDPLELQLRHGTEETPKRFEQFIGHWTQMNENQHSGYLPSAQDFIKALNEETSGFLVYNTDTLFSYPPLQHFIDLSLPKCLFAGLFQKVHTPSSSTHQNEENATKSVLERELQRPTSTAIFFTLFGCRAIMLPQGNVGIAQISICLEEFLQHTLDEGRTIGQASLLMLMKWITEKLGHKRTPYALSQEHGTTNTLDLIPVGSKAEIQGNDVASDFCESILYGLPNIVFAPARKN